MLVNPTIYFGQISTKWGLIKFLKNKNKRKNINLIGMLPSDGQFSCCHFPVDRNGPQLILSSHSGNPPPGEIKGGEKGARKEILKKG